MPPNGRTFAKTAPIIIAQETNLSKSTGQVSPWGAGFAETRTMIIRERDKSRP